MRVVSNIDQRIDPGAALIIAIRMIYIPNIHDRVVQKSTLTLCRVTFVNIHNRTVDLFTLSGVGELIKDVPYA